MSAQHYRADHWVNQGLFDNLSTFRGFEKRVDEIEEEKDRGDVFEIFVEAMLETQPILQCEKHWVVGNVPLSIREGLKLPAGTKGIDGVYRDVSGDHVPYQVKYRKADHLTYTEVSPFLGVTEKATDRVIFSNASRLTEDAQRDTVRAVLADWFHALGPDEFRAIETWLKQKPAKPQRAVPDPRHQPQALAEIAATLKTNDRASIVMACGTGKTLVSLWAVEQAKPRIALVLLPSILLLKQTLKEWNKHTSLKGGFHYRCICSDKTVGLRYDEPELDISEAGFKIDTDPASVRTFLEQDSKRVKIVFTTYQSSPVVGEAITGLPPFDIAVFDEAHKTTGRVGTGFTFGLSDENIPIRKRLFFTATPRHYNTRRRNKEGDLLFASMDDEEIYGPRAHTLTFGAAVKLGVICPYKVIITLIDKQMVADFALRHGITLVGDDLLMTRWVASLIAMARAITSTNARKAITFHSRVKTAEDLAGEDVRGVGRYLSGYEVRHVNGKQNARDRQIRIEAFREAPAGVLTNAKCLTEGVDVPAVDMVAFIDPKKSRIDIAQAIGRAMRKPRGNGKQKKTIGYVVVPLFAGASDDQTLDEAIQSQAFDVVADVINALAEHDEDLLTIIGEMRRQKGEGRPVDRRRLLEKVEVIGPNVDLERLTESISIEISDRLGSSWEERFGELLAYMARFHNCNVPDVWEENPALAKWVSHQRTAYKAGTLSKERIHRLCEIEFVWDQNAAYFEENYTALKSYRDDVGNSNVPAKYSSNPKLGAFVRAMRREHKRWRKCKEAGEGFKNEATWVTRFRSLDKLGFDFELKKNLDNKWEAQWEDVYQELVRHVEKHGHFHVTRRENRRLANWITNQRSKRRRLADWKTKLLDEIQFSWSGPDAEWEEGLARWREWTAASLDAKSQRVSKPRSVVAWESNQIKKWRRKGKSPKQLDREKRMIIAGFRFQGEWEDGCDFWKEWTKAPSGPKPRRVTSFETRQRENWRKQNKSQKQLDRERRLEVDGFVFDLKRKS